MNKKAVIFGIRSLKLSRSEIELFKKVKPWGIILFSRNIKNIQQVKKLTNSIKNIFKSEKYPILIDQEGGKVSRINKIIDLSYFSQRHFGKLYSKNRKAFFIHYLVYINAVSNLLNEIGININTVPVLDIERENAHNIIGSRSFSKNVNEVVKIGKFCIKNFEKNKIATVTKHIPGHGLSKCDSHYDTPTISTNKNKLIKNDFKPFKFCKSYFTMTGHIIYSSYDKINTCTHSKTLINDVIRKQINFKGILISDDISMKSLKFSLEQNAVKAFDAGCNLILHCNANIKEMHKLSKVIPYIDKFTEKKTSQFFKFLG